MEAGCLPAPQNFKAQGGVKLCVAVAASDGFDCDVHGVPFVVDI
jgi:hypothetical protein